MKKITIGAIAASLLLMSGCTWKNSAVSSPVNIANTDMNQVKTMKSGESCQRQLLIFPIGFDATAKTAAEKAKISKIKYQETSGTVFWPVYSSRCIKVYGE